MNNPIGKMYYEKLGAVYWLVGGVKYQDVVEEYPSGYLCVINKDSVSPLMYLPKSQFGEAPKKQTPTNVNRERK